MIKRLAKDVSTRIAAGEVIERPSSVAKELIENSIDASAKSITIYLEQGGKSSFVIEDDGIGIEKDELPLALERYATSKISTLDDLESIKTLGYRGEALASIAAVSLMEIRSRTSGSESGGIIRCECGIITLHADNPCLLGTRIQVDDLFCSLPARRKFLKSASAELRRIIQIVNDYALIHPGLTFRIISDGKKILERLPVSDVAGALELKWGAQAQIYHSEVSSGAASVRLWWNPIADSRRVVLTLFVNDRRVQDSTVRAAICGGDAAAYGEWLVLVNIPPEQVDVNIHPTKEEIRFRRSQDIFKLVYDAAHNIFAERHSIHRGESADSDTVLHGQDFFLSQVKQQSQIIDKNNRLFSNEPWRPNTLPGAGRVAEPREESAEYIPTAAADLWDASDDKHYIGQTAMGFLLFDFPHALAIMDPHAAHERILYEDILLRFSSAVDVQNLVLPEEIPFALLPEVSVSKDELERLGFICSGNSLQGVPAIRGKGHIQPIDMLRSALRGITSEKDPAKRDREVWWRMARLACRGAVKLGQRIDKVEAEELMRKLELCETPYSCPHGRMTLRSRCH